MDNNEAELETKLAAYRNELNAIAAPADLEDRVFLSIEQRLSASASAQPSEQPVDRFWLWAGCAASIAAVSIGLLLTGDAEENVIRQQADLPTVNTITSYPVRVHSLSHGAQWRYVQSQTVKDQRGITRLLVVNPQGDFYVQ
ncbi:MAG: hypothetical protein AAF542_06190 [Pseudomonadota bacterium]